MTRLRNNISTLFVAEEINFLFISKLPLDDEADSFCSSERSRLAEMRIFRITVPRLSRIRVPPNSEFLEFRYRVYSLIRFNRYVNFTSILIEFIFEISPDAYLDTLYVLFLGSLYSTRVQLVRIIHS